VLRDSLEALAVEYGDERVALFLVDKGRRVGAVEPETGAVTLHGLAEESAVVYIRASGDIEVLPKTGAKVYLGASPLVALTDGVVVAQGVDPFTGTTYGILGNASAVVMAKK
jgi:hypothetical protein